MSESRQETLDWYDDADALEPARAIVHALPEVPDSWQHFSWWLASAAYSALWLLESWTANFRGPNALGPLAESVWALLLSLAICYGIYNFAKATSGPLAH